MKVKKRILATILVAIPLLVVGVWWWFNDPFRGVSGIEVDQTIYFHEAAPVFVTPRRQRTLFIRGVSGEKLLAQTKERYPERDGWTYRTNGMPRGFRATRPVPGDELPEMITAFDALDGRYKLMELRTMSNTEIQVVKRTQGSAAFLIYPGAPVYRTVPGELDTSRFLTGP